MISRFFKKTVKKYFITFGILIAVILLFGNSAFRILVKGYRKKDLLKQRISYLEAKKNF
ncbi:hypothetical protein ACFL4S_01190 [bacterium]